MSNMIVISSENSVTPAASHSNTTDEVNRRGTKRKLELNFSPMHSTCRPNKRMTSVELHPDEYAYRFSQIVDNIWYNCGTVVLVWCLTNLLKADFVSSLAHQYGNVIRRQDRWRSSSSQKGLADWIGVTIFYEKSKDAEKAAKEMPMRSKHIKTYNLQEHINDVADIESRQPSFHPSFSRVIITCLYNLTKEDEKQLRKECKKFGQLRNVDCVENTLVATYKYLSHAYLAVRVLDQKVFQPVGRLYASLEPSEYNDDIFAELKAKISFEVFSLIP